MNQAMMVSERPACSTSLFKRMNYRLLISVHLEDLTSCTVQHIKNDNISRIYYDEYSTYLKLALNIVLMDLEDHFKCIFQFSEQLLF